jgi:hypothetical protein
VLLERGPHQLDQPGPDDRAVAPVVEQRRQGQLELGAHEHLRALRDRLHHAELDRVVDQLGEVRRAGPTGEDRAALVEREVPEQRLDDRVAE